MHLLAVIGKVDTKVHEVIAAKTRLIDDPLQHCLVDFVGNITKHDLRQGKYRNSVSECKGATYSCADINSLSDTMNVNVVMMTSSRVGKLSAAQGVLRGSSSILTTATRAAEVTAVAVMFKCLRIGVAKAMVIVLLLEAKLMVSLLVNSAGGNGPVALVRIESITYNCWVVVAKVTCA